jgi:hypothetical protein
MGTKVKSSAAKPKLQPRTKKRSQESIFGKNPESENPEFRSQEIDPPPPRLPVFLVMLSWRISAFREDSPSAIDGKTFEPADFEHQLRQ